MKTFWVSGLNKMGLESGTYVLASEAEAEIKRIKSETGMSYHSCNKPDYHHRVKQLESQLTAAAERERVLRNALKDAIDSMDNDCDYEENHRSASEQARAALEVK